MHKEEAAVAVIVACPACGKEMQRSYFSAGDNIIVFYCTNWTSATEKCPRWSENVLVYTDENSSRVIEQIEQKEIPIVAR